MIVVLLIHTQPKFCIVISITNMMLSIISILLEACDKCLVPKLSCFVNEILVYSIYILSIAYSANYNDFDWF